MQKVLSSNSENINCLEKLSNKETNRYHILDGLRGVAALMVIWFHFFEAFATSPADQKFNHGYLAVDFFFILSGFVVGFAYDGRWGKMTVWDFFKRRVIRLHPMVIMGMILGGMTFLIQGGVQWNGAVVSSAMLIISLILSFFLIPVAPGMGADVRGNGEMYPLNGPSWSLFFEYLGNLFYALVLRHFSLKVLAGFVFLMGCGLITFAIGNFSGFGHIGVGWSLGEYNFIGGLLRVMFSFSAGLLMVRIFKPVRIKWAFELCSLAIIFLLSVPYLGNNILWLNGLYDSLCVLVFFPLLVFCGASGKVKNSVGIKFCDFLGKISYPIYLIHYPFMYLFYAWIWGNGIFKRSPESGNIPLAQAWPVILIIFFGSIFLAYLFLKFYDEPMRQKLSKKYLSSKK